MFLFGTNTKLQHTPEESVVFVRELAAHASAGAMPDGIQLWYAPPFTSLIAVADMCKLSRIRLTAQNCHAENVGIGTGEIAPRILRACGVEMVMLGHAERRRDFGEGNRKINAKVLAALDENLDVLLCIGETALERDYGIAQNTLAAQMRIALFGVENAARIHILYEPAWAIGAGAQAADPRDIAGALRLIRAELRGLFGAAGALIPILYGGSVNAENAAHFAALPGCGGLGVGRAAWTATSFNHVLQAALSGWQQRDAHENENNTDEKID
jgi:L-erythrulose 1-phosphate isomerase